MKISSNFPTADNFRIATTITSTILGFDFRTPIVHPYLLLDLLGMKIQTGVSAQGSNQLCNKVTDRNTVELTEIFFSHVACDSSQCLKFLLSTGSRL